MLYWTSSKIRICRRPGDQPRLKTQFPRLRIVVDGVMGAVLTGFHAGLDFETACHRPLDFVAHGMLARFTLCGARFELQSLNIGNPPVHVTAARCSPCRATAARGVHRDRPPASAVQSDPEYPPTQPVATVTQWLRNGRPEALALSGPMLMSPGETRARYFRLMSVHKRGRPTVMSNRATA